jgi:reverse transcriptase-like protein
MINYLRVIVGKDALKMDSQKLKRVTDWHKSNTHTDVHSFLGFTGYYRYVIPNYSKIAQPLLELIRKNITWHWEPMQFKAFKTLKTLMCQRPIFIQPNFYTWLYLQTNASIYGMGIVLLQEREVTNTSLDK